MFTVVSPKKSCHVSNVPLFLHPEKTAVEESCVTIRGCDWLAVVSTGTAAAKAVSEARLQAGVETQMQVLTQ